jgi:hypothetical protein
MSSDHLEQTAQIEIAEDEWGTLAAVAWMGYQAKGRGLVVLDLEADEEEVSQDNDSRNQTESRSCQLYYLPKDAEQVRMHAKAHNFLLEWIDSYDPNKSILLAIAISECVFYVHIGTPGESVTPPLAILKDRQAGDILDPSQDSTAERWPILATQASVQSLDSRGKVLAINLPMPIEENITRSMESALDDAQEKLLEMLRVSASQMLQERLTYRKGFEDRLYEGWGKALDLYETLLVFCFEVGNNFNQQHRPEAAQCDDFVFEVLTRLHAKACLTASEILALLRGGYASGAFARWRTMHEIAVIVRFVEDSGQEVARRYLEHEHIQTYRAAKEFNAYCNKLGYDRFDRAEMKSFQEAHNHFIAKYGDSFAQDYGWADEALDKLDPTHGGKATFSRLEQAVDLDHWRPYYGMASYGVHANTKGITFNLGLSNQSKVMLAGPSNAGLADPGQSACLSLAQATAALLSYKSEPNFSNVLQLKVIFQLVKEAEDAFIEAHLKLEADAAELEAE